MKKLNWPFVLVVDSHQRAINWVLLNGPIVTSAQQAQFAELRCARFHLAGMSSYINFPLTEPADALDYETVCEAWCHCFREPDQFFTTNIPRDLISMSDFTDYHRVCPGRFRSCSGPAEFDLIYVGANDDWKRTAKNWCLAALCLPRICAELNLRALVIGDPNKDFGPTERITFIPHLPWERFLSHLAAAELLFVPNALDPSPKLLGEALCLDVPIVVNRQILGGWKYVNAFTGVFFDDESDVVAAVRTCLSRARHPRNWFCANYGPYHSGRRLLKLLKRVDPEISERTYLCVVDEENETTRPARY